MRLSDYDFDLPEERIAQVPSPDRNMSRMMVVERQSGAIRHSRTARIADELAAGDLLVLNDTRVFPARLHGELAGGATAEALFLRSLGGGEWVLLLRPSRKVRPGTVVRFPSVPIEGEAVRRAGEGEWVVRFPAEIEIEPILEREGEIPLPPYIRRKPNEEDRRRYQTVFARETGSVAAPTAGLHFTDELLGVLETKGIETARVTLHVGPGTFRPIRTESIEDHTMEEEWYRVPEETAAAVRAVRERGGRLFAVGTTVVRTLESADAGDGLVRAGSGSTDLFLYPPRRPKVVDGMLTNFHLPRSTLFLLVCAVAGLDLMGKAYALAMEEEYRFYSYGDSMLII